MGSTAGAVGLSAFESYSQKTLPAYASVTGRAAIASDIQTVITDLSYIPAHKATITDQSGNPLGTMTVPTTWPDTSTALHDIKKVQGELQGAGKKFVNPVLGVETTLYDATRKNAAALAPQRRELRGLLGILPGLSQNPLAKQYVSDGQTTIRVGLPLGYAGVIAAGGAIGFEYSRKRKSGKRQRR